MTSARTVAITGSTGRLGGLVARRLAERGVDQRLIVRDPNRAPQLAGAQSMRAAYGDAPAVRVALEGAGTVLMVSASEAVDRVVEHRTFVDAAVEAGIEHLIYVSFCAARPTATFTLARDHAATEQYIRASGLPFTFLRDNLYADFLPSMVGADGVIRGPAGQGRVAAVAQADIADVAVAVLEAPSSHLGATHDLTGPQPLSLEEIAAIIGAAAGRAITYYPETLDEAYASRAAFGAPDWQVEAWVSTYTAIAAGEMASVSDAVPRITGHPATSLADLLGR